MQSIVSTPLTFGSLFAGIGGIDLGFERAGLVCKWQVEINQYARKVLQKHWPEVPKHDDIRTFDATTWVDVIVAGFPCQDISYAGKGAGLSGERSGLFYEAVRVIREVGPRIIVLENVAALLTRGIGDVLGTLASIGFDCEWHCIPASAVGAPHRRDRIFVLGWNTNGVEQNSQRGVCRRTIADTERNSVRVSDSESIGCGTRRQWRTAGLGSGQEGTAIVADSTNADRREDGCAATAGGTEHGQQFGGAFGRAMPRDDWWASEPAVGRVADGVPNRVDRIRGLGNAVVPQVAEFIGRCLVAASKEVT